MIKLKTRFLDLEAGAKSVVLLNTDDAENLGVLSLGRVKVRFNQR